MQEDVIVRNGNNLILLIKFLLCDDFNKLSDVNVKLIYKIARFHSLENILYYAINKYKEKDASIDFDIILKQLEYDHKQALAKASYQDVEKEILSQNLRNMQIKHMFLKGSIIKYLYPSIDMRTMSDIDIYIEAKRAKDVKKQMKELGYDVISYGQTHHDTYQKRPFMDVEMHRDLMNESYKMHAYYRNIKHKLIQIENICEYKFSNEDYYIYMIAHAAKHFSTAGIGIRNMIDEYLYLNKYAKELDFKYIDGEINKLGISKFENNLKNLALYWFANAQYDENQEKILNAMAQYIFESGTYGTTNHHVLNDFMVDDKPNKFSYCLRRLFPNYKFMCGRNPILKKIPILLPWFYFVRILKAIFHFGKIKKSEIEYANNIKSEDINENKKIHEDVGA